MEKPKKSISFYNIKKDKGTLEFNAKRSDSSWGTDIKYWKWQGSNVPSDKAVELALRSLLNPSFTDVSMGLEVKDQKLPGKGDYILLFSGGADSLAAAALFPEVRKVFIRWTENSYYAHEFNFAKQFNPEIIETNTRDFNLFISMGFIALMENFDKIIMGQVFESAQNGGFENVSAFTDYDPSNPPYMKGFPWKQYNLFCLTEVGTSMIVKHYFEDLMPQVLENSSPPGIIKRRRKELLYKAIGFNDFALSQPPQKKAIFGESLQEDLVAVYLIKKLGYEDCKDFIEVPKNVIELITQANVGFCERINTNLISGLPPEFLGIAIDKMYAAGLKLYTEKDFADLRWVVKNILSPDNVKYSGHIKAE